MRIRELLRAGTDQSVQQLRSQSIWEPCLKLDERRPECVCSGKCVEIGSENGMDAYARRPE